MPNRASLLKTAMARAALLLAALALCGLTGCGLLKPLPSPPPESLLILDEPVKARVMTLDDAGTTFTYTVRIPAGWGCLNIGPHPFEREGGR